MRKILSLPILLCSFSALADINVRDASFRQTFKDLSIDTGVSFQRTYNSRSLHKGLFGFGWCSDFEKTLQIDKSSGSASLQDCTLDSPVSVNPVFLRGQWKIRQRNQTLLFNMQGQLVEIELTSSYSIKVQYKKGQLARITFPGKLKLSFQAHPKTNFVERISSSRGDEIHFYYEDQNLSIVTNSQQPPWNYQYDELHNLTAVFKNHSLMEKITYDTNRDQVLLYQGREGCLDQFTYLPKTKELESTTILQRECPQRSLEFFRFHFQFLKNQDGTISLTNLSVKSKSGMTSYLFNKVTGEQKNVSRKIVGGLH